MHIRPLPELCAMKGRRGNAQGHCILQAVVLLCMCPVVSGIDLTRIGDELLSAAGWDICARGDYSYLPIVSKGLVVIDHTDRTAPVRVTWSVPGITSPGACTFAGTNTLVVAAASEAYVVDITDPRNPNVVKVLPVVAATAVFGWGDKVMFAGCPGGPQCKVSVADVSNPSAAFVQGSGNAQNRNGFGREISVSGEYFYVTGGQNKGALTYHLPTFMGTGVTKVTAIMDSGIGTIHGLACSGNYLYLAANTLSVIDVTDPMAPIFLTANTPIQQTGNILISADANHVYVCDGGSTNAEIYDVSVPTAAVLAGSMTLLYKCGDMDHHGTEHFVHTISDMEIFVDASPTPVPTLTPPTAIPDTLVPPTTVPDTLVPPTAIPDTLVPPTAIPDTLVPPTTIPDTLVPPTAIPDTLVPPTAIPPTTVPDTLVPPTAIPDTLVPPTAIPDTLVPPTAVPDTLVPPTTVPDTLVPPTTVPDTLVPPTAIPDTLVPPTAIPNTLVPPTTIPETVVPPTALPDTLAPPTTVPDTLVPPTTVPDTLVPPTTVPDTLVPPTAIPNTLVPPTAIPDTLVPPTAIPDTLVPPTTVPDTLVPPTAIPDTLVPPTAIPDTLVPPTTIPDTLVPPTAIPDTLVPPTAIPPTTVPDTLVPPTAIPDTLVPPTAIPDTLVPPTAVPDTLVPPTTVPDTLVPPTTVPDTLVPPTAIPDTLVPPTAIPNTLVPPTTIPETVVPPTALPDTLAPPTTVPDTLVPPTTVPDTLVPPTTVPDTLVPPTAIPNTLVPPTAIPDTLVPPTAIPDTLVPPTTVPDTLVPPTAIPDTLVPPTAIPDTLVPPTTIPDTLVPPTAIPGSTAVPNTLVPGSTAVPDTLAPGTTAAPDTLVPGSTAVPTLVPFTAVPDTLVPPTNVPDTFVPQTNVPDTLVPPTTVPETSVPPTDVPETVVPLPATLVPGSTAVPDTLTPGTTAVPDTLVPGSTAVPDTLTPGTTAVPDTLVPGSTAVPDTLAPGTTAVPDTLAPGTTAVPATLTPGTTAVPDTLVPGSTAVPDTLTPGTTAVPATLTPGTTAVPDTLTPGTTAVPATLTPGTTAVPDTLTPGTTAVPDTLVPGSTAVPATLTPGTTAVPDTLTPGTTAVPDTLVPGSTAVPATLTPGTTAVPDTLAPGTTAVPDTLVPGSTAVPATLTPGTTAVPDTLAPGTTAVPDTLVPGSTAVPATLTPGTTAVPDTLAPGTTAVPDTLVPGSTAVPDTLTPGTTAVPATLTPGTTAVPDTLVPGSTAVPDTLAPGTTAVPDTLVPGSTAVPDTLTPGTTAVPATLTPGTTAVPATLAPGTTAVPDTLVPGSTAVPDTLAPGTTAVPDTLVPGSTAVPDTLTPGTTAVPATLTPGTTAVPDTLVPGSTAVPDTLAPGTTAVPDTLVPGSTAVPDTLTPGTTAVPATLTPGTTAVPDTLVPGSTAVPDTLAPGTTAVPDTLVPGSTAVPDTLAPGTTAVPDTLTPGTTAVPDTLVPGSTAVPDTLTPGTTAVPDTLVPGSTAVPDTLTPGTTAVPDTLVPGSTAVPDTPDQTIPAAGATDTPAAGLAFKPMQLSKVTEVSSKQVNTDGALLRVSIGAQAVAGPLVIAVEWPGGSTLVSALGGRKCEGGPCVIIVCLAYARVYVDSFSTRHGITQRTNRSPTDSKYGVAASASKAKEYFVNAEIEGGELTVSMQGPNFRVFAPRDEELGILISADLIPRSNTTACSQQLGDLDPSKVLVIEVGPSFDMHCSCAGCAAMTGLEAQQASLPFTPFQEKAISVVQATVVAMAGASSVMPISSPMSAGSMVKLSAVTRVCPQKKSISMDITLNPFGLEFGDDERLREVNGALVAGIAMQGVLLLICFAVAFRLNKQLLSRREAARGFDAVVGLESNKASVVHTGLNKDAATYLLARSRFGWMVVPLVYLMAGTAMASTSALLYSSILFKLIAICDVLLFVTSILVISYYFAKNSVKHSHYRKIEQSRRLLTRYLCFIFWGWDEWVAVSRESGPWFELAHHWFDSYKMEHRFYLVFELLSCLALGVISGWAPGTYVECWIKAGVSQAVLLACLVSLIWWRPYLSLFDNASMIAITAAQMGSLAFMMIAMEHQEDMPAHWASIWAAKLATITVELVLAKMLVDVVVFVIDEYNAWQELSEGEHRGVCRFIRHILCCGNSTGKRLANFVAEDVRVKKQADNPLCPDKWEVSDDEQDELLQDPLVLASRDSEVSETLLQEVHRSSGTTPGELSLEQMPAEPQHSVYRSPSRDVLTPPDGPLDLVDPYESRNSTPVPLRKVASTPFSVSRINTMLYRNKKHSSVDLQAVSESETPEGEPGAATRRSLRIPRLGSLNRPKRGASLNFSAGDKLQPLCRDDLTSLLNARHSEASLPPPHPSGATPRERSFSGAGNPLGSPDQSPQASGSPERRHLSRRRTTSKDHLLSMVSPRELANPDSPVPDDGEEASWGRLPSDDGSRLRGSSPLDGVRASEPASNAQRLTRLRSASALSDARESPVAASPMKLTRKRGQTFDSPPRRKLSLTALNNNNPPASVEIRPPRFRSMSQAGSQKSVSPPPGEQMDIVRA